MIKIGQKIVSNKDYISGTQEGRMMSTLACRNDISQRIKRKMMLQPRLKRRLMRVMQLNQQ